MGFEGFVLLGVTVLVIAVVIPTLTRHRFVAAHTPLGDRYADDLRMLRVGDAPEAVVSDGGETRGSVFFKRPEVEMARESMVNVRQLARDRARLRAVMSERAAKLQRGFWGACALGALTILSWILVAATNLAAFVAIAAMGLTAVYIAVFVRMVINEGKADEANREELRRIEEQLPRRAKPRTAGVGGAKRPSVHDSSGRSRISARASRSADRNRGKQTPGRASTSQGRAEKLAEIGEVRGAGTRENRRGTLEAQALTDSADGRVDLRKGTTVDDRSTASENRGVERGRIVTSGNSAKASRMQAASRAKAKGAQPHASDSALGNAGSGAGGHSANGRQEIRARASIPSYTLKPRGFGRRVVDPYVAPTEPTAAVPYRPQSIGEVYNAATGTVNTTKAGANTLINGKRNGLDVAGVDEASKDLRGYGQYGPVSGVGAHRDAGSQAAGGYADVTGGHVENLAEDSVASDVRAQRASEENNSSVVDSGETLSGGSVLDELLERRRA